MATSKPIPMRLYSSWEVDSASPGSVPRICTLNLLKLSIKDPGENDYTGPILIAVKMRGSKARILRSNEITLTGGVGELDLDITFSLQYPHQVKASNSLQVLLQRRKRYKNRPMLGFKTLAVGVLDLTQIMQGHTLDLLYLTNKLNDSPDPVAVLVLSGLNSQPIESESYFNHNQRLFSDDDMDEYESATDVDDFLEEEDRKRRRHPAQDIKEKFKRILGKKNIPISSALLDERVDDLIEDVDNLSMSEDEPPEDNISIRSAPKPTLNPFFDESLALVPEPSNFANSDSSESDEDDSEEFKNKLVKMKSLSSDVGVTEFCDKKKNLTGSSDNNENSDTIIDQLTSAWPDSNLPPNHLALINSVESVQYTVLQSKLRDLGLKVVHSPDLDSHIVLQFLMTNFQKYRKNNSVVQQPVRCVLIGRDTFINSIVGAYVEHISDRYSEWQGYLNFMAIPLGTSCLSKYICRIDSTYGGYFNDSTWTHLTDRGQLDNPDVISRIEKYITTADCVYPVPILEAMVMHCGKDSSDESKQTLVPFLSEVRIGSSTDVLSPHLSFENSDEIDGLPSCPIAAGLELTECVDLQVECFKLVGKQPPTKSILKGSYKLLQVSKLAPGSGETVNVGFRLLAIPKEKNRKMRIVKKPNEAKNIDIDGIHRLVCSASGSKPPCFRLYIDGTDWAGVKFFQLSSLSSSRVKTFPLVLFAEG